MRLGPIEIAVLLAAAVLVFWLMARGRNGRGRSASLAEIFDEPSTPLPGHKARVWALATLYDAGVDPDTDPAYAAKVLLEAEPRLTPIDANALVDVLNHP